MESTEAIDIGRHVAKSVLDACFIRASEGLGYLPLLDQIAASPALFLKPGKLDPWENLKGLITLQVEVPQRQERLNQEIDHIHTAIDEAKRSNLPAKEIRGQLTNLMIDLKDDAQMEILEELVDCACKS